MKKHRRFSLNTSTDNNTRTPVLSLFLFILLLLPASALAERHRYVLHYNDARFHGSRGMEAVLYLKKELRRQYPGVDISALELKKVELVAKTGKGQGKAMLRVGSLISDPYRIKGRPAHFKSRRHNTYDRVAIRAPHRSNRGPWQLHLRGKVKVKKVILVTEDRYRRPMYGWWSYRR